MIVSQNIKIGWENLVGSLVCVGSIGECLIRIHDYNHTCNT